MATQIKYVKNKGGLVSSVNEEVYEQLMSMPAHDGNPHFVDATDEEAAACDARENPAPVPAAAPAESGESKGKGK